MKAKITFEAEKCAECPYCKNNYCTTAKRETPKSIPDWCPFVLQQYLIFLLSLDDDPDWKSCMQANTSNPWKLPELAFDKGLNHAIRTAHYAKHFIHDLADHSFKDFLYGEECHSVERDQYLMTIAAMIRDVGEHDPNIPKEGRLDKFSYLKESEFCEEDKDIITDAVLHWDEVDKLIEDFDKMKEFTKVHRRKPTLDTGTAVKISLLLGSMLDVGPGRVTRSTYEVYANRNAPMVDSEIRSLALALKKVENVEFKLVYNENYGKVTGPNPKNAAELHYSVTDEFKVNTLKLWPELVQIPRRIAKEFLGLKSFKFFVNDRQINIRQITG